MQSTVFADVDPASELAQHEVFGPVLSLIPFSSEKEAIAIANNTQYGLAAYLNTRDVTRAHRLAGELKAGSISINGARPLKPTAPFGGRGLSGYGREGGRQGIEEFVRPKTVQIAAE
jgi:aldehyde dehydrogenase (NAD+)